MVAATIKFTIAIGRLEYQSNNIDKDAEVGDKSVDEEDNN